MTRRIRLGRIDYTNVLPLFYYFPYNQFVDELEIMVQIPTGLNRAMTLGEIDIGPISSFAYGQSFEDYVLFPDLSVSSVGKVGSLLLFHKEPFENIVNGTISLTTSSATTAHLLRIIIAKFYNGCPTYLTASPNLDEMMKSADAALLIGDDAIRANRSNTSYRVTDLGELWNRHTGESMTYAVWAVSKKAVSQQPALVNRIYDSFVVGKKHCFANLEPVAQEAISKAGGNKSDWITYFYRLCYDFGPTQWRGLQLFFQYAWELGLLERPVSIQIWEPGGMHSHTRKDKSPQQVNE